jgi:hypothetical protein
LSPQRCGFADLRFFASDFVGAQNDKQSTALHGLKRVVD